ncbi:AraC family transcriptional regulator [Paenibacillus sp. 79R4]|uniref:AraC family transcriptional regulator n=1 Tax=Paenibacillus sp. 79R4 TaxID=2212847 RepID=UPI0015B95733|nr:helix-turn-helix domain-containing protein [Paenibacillus sp. 79R4]NWL87608.1 AraC family transcriptional regulator [Paenibacillus sp. 79R4]
MMIHANHIQTDLQAMMVRLWHADFYNQNGLNLEQQLAMQNALIIVIKGELDLELEGRTVHLSEGSVQLCPCGRTFGAKSGVCGLVTAAVFHFSLYQADTSCKEAIKEVTDLGACTLWEDHIVVSSAENLKASSRKVYRNFHHSQPQKQWRAQLDFQELLYELVAESGNVAGIDKAQALERAKAYIEEHYDEELTIQRLAEVAEFSPKYFADLFKKTYRHSVMDYVTQVRMAKAKQLMLGSGALLKEIAPLVGYKDEFYFSRKFKKEMGLSPSAYMKERSNRIALYGSTSLLGYLTPLQIIPYAAPLHPKWSSEQYHSLGPDIPVHLDAYRQNHNKEANLEKLAAAKPERIICVQELEPWEKRRLAQIAPVHELALESGDWKGELMTLAALLDRKAEAEQWLQSFERNIIRLRLRIIQYMQPPAAVVVRIYQNQLVLDNSQAVHAVLYKLLGCEIPPNLQEANPYTSLIVEQLAMIKAKHIFVLVRQDSETLAYWKELSSSPAWMSIQAVREGTMHLINSYPWREHSPAAMEQMAEAATDLLTGKSPC